MCDSIATKNQDTVFVMTEDGNLTSIATAKILKLCITGESETVHSEIPSKISVMLDDGSLLSFSRVTLSRGVVSGTFASDQAVSIPDKHCRSIRLSSIAEYGLAWQQFSQKESTTTDMIAVRRPGGVLDSLEGQIQGLTETNLSFELDGQKLEVPLAKLEGLLLRRRPSDLPTARALVSTKMQRVMARDLSFTKEELLIETVTGLHLKFPRESFEVDFSLSKAKSLGDLEPRVLVWKPLKSGNQHSMLTALLQPQAVPFQEQKLNIGSGHNSTQVELRGELQLKIPLRGEYAWLHGQAHSTSIDKPQIIFRADGSDLLMVAGTDVLAEGHSFSLSLSAVRELILEISPGTLIQLRNLVFVKKD